ncbi:MAG: dihydrolipoamide acetyltransferase component of pyruvate dehydrogenase complex [Chloroflexota bacterium]|nr:MAG: dihydrolipoamide acetyltransferase component of pyruvate dehydrogenase complex [Chloroflexota bacterium]
MKIIMPKLGLTMTEGTLARWCKAEGDTIKQGEILFEFENDKSVMEFESPTDGILTQITVREGETVPCGTAVAHLETAPTQPPIPTPGAPHSAAQPPISNTLTDSAQLPYGTRLQSPIAISATPAAKRVARELGVDLLTIIGRGPQGRIHLADVEAIAKVTTSPAAPALSREIITPIAKKLASELELDWTQITGSGMGGRVVKEDVLQAAAPPSSPKLTGPPTRFQSLLGIRGVIARRMSESAFTAPHVTLFAEANASTLVEARAQLNAELAGVIKVSYDTLLVAIVARLLPEYPYLNAYISGEAIHFYDEVNIALAVDTERGLLAPVIYQANQLDLVTIQKTSDTLTQRALSGKSLPEELTGGTFTISNLGMFDIDGFTPIINQPQAAILGLGRIVPKPVVAAGNEVVVRQMMTLSLSFDHRLVDGGPAARFLQRVKQLIERPFALIIPLGRI